MDRGAAEARVVVGLIPNFSFAVGDLDFRFYFFFGRCSVSVVRGLFLTYAGETNLPSTAFRRTITVFLDMRDPPFHRVLYSTRKRHASNRVPSCCSYHMLWSCLHFHRLLPSRIAIVCRRPSDLLILFDAAPWSREPVLDGELVEVRADF